MPNAHTTVVSAESCHIHHAYFSTQEPNRTPIFPNSKLSCPRMSRYLGSPRQYSTEQSTHQRKNTLATTRTLVRKKFTFTLYLIEPIPNENIYPLYFQLCQGLRRKQTTKNNKGTTSADDNLWRKERSKPTAFMKSSFLKSILSKWPSIHSGSARPNKRRGEEKTKE